MLTLALLVVGVGGAKAGKVYGHLTAEGGFGATWNAVTETMGWNSVGNYHPNFRILLTGLPSGDITGYTKFHATLSNFSENATYVRLRIKSNDGENDHYADVNLVDGENNVDLKALAEANPEVDFTNVKDITIWSPGSAEEGKTVNESNPASVKIQNVYMQRVKNVVFNSLGDEITDLDYITNGGWFVIGNSEGTKVQTYLNYNPGASATNDVSGEMYYYMKIEAAPDTLDVNQDGTQDGVGYYGIRVYNASESAHSGYYGQVSQNYICRIGWGDLWISNFEVNMDGKKLTTNHFGRDNAYSAVWTVEYEEGKGFKFYNPEHHQYMNIAGTQNDVCYLRLYKSIISNVNTEFDKEDNAANDAIFALADATGYNAETGEMTNPEWTFATPVDISNWDYLMITTVNNPTSTGGAVTITDDNGVSVGGEGYSGSTAGTGGNMWLDRWNNQNAIRISIDYLRINKSMDITKIKSLRIGGTTKIANVYLTDYNNTKISGGYKDGDVKREYTAAKLGKFGTICLPYVASYSGAEVYSISGKSGSSISLTKVTGLLEAGKPYFYVAADANGKDNGANSVDIHNVNFFRADLAKYDAASAGTDNGLIGTFVSTKAPLNSYVLSSNKLYQVDKADAVTVGDNKAYVDLSAITPSLSRGNVFIDFDEPTGIKTIKGSEEMSKESVFFDLQGRRVAQPVKGMYIVNGKKVMVK